MKREELLNYVFENRRREADELREADGNNGSEETSSLIISAITTSALPTANASETDLHQNEI